LQQLDQKLAAEKITGEAATLRRAEFLLLNESTINDKQQVRQKLFHI
jgi:hypothetical protein